MKLEIHNLTKTFLDQTVLDNFTYTCEAKQCLVILGSSGCGKSTLLRILSGLISADSGRIIINGESLPHQEKLLRAYRKKLGIVFQSANLFSHLSALDNLLLPLEKVHHLSHTQALQRAENLLKKFQLSEHKHKKPAHLSGGQRQRIAIARALAHEPKLLLLDEPTSALDPEMAGEVFQTIQQLKEEGTHLILITHQVAFARRVADEIIFLAQGKVIESGSATALLSQPQSKSLQNFLSRQSNDKHEQQRGQSF